MNQHDSRSQHERRKCILRTQQRQQQRIAYSTRKRNIQRGQHGPQITPEQCLRRQSDQQDRAYSRLLRQQQRRSGYAASEQLCQPEQTVPAKILPEGLPKIVPYIVRHIAHHVDRAAAERRSGCAERKHRKRAENKQQVQLEQLPEFPHQNLEKQGDTRLGRCIFFDARTFFQVARLKQCHFSSPSRRY